MKSNVMLICLPVLMFFILGMSLHLNDIGSLSNNPNWTAECNLAGAQFGTSVASAGDVNKDGYDDVIVESIFRSILEQRILITKICGQYHLAYNCRVI